MRGCVIREKDILRIRMSGACGGQQRAYLPGEDYCYVRYMDDFLLLTRTRWQLRRGIARLSADFETGGFERHPGKTQTGRLESGFDWLGIGFGAGGPTLSPGAIKNHRERRLRLYEQARAGRASESEAQARVQAYESRWMAWGSRLLTAASQRSE